MFHQIGVFIKPLKNKSYATQRNAFYGSKTIEIKIAA